MWQVRTGCGRLSIVGLAAPVRRRPLSRSRAKVRSSSFCPKGAGLAAALPLRSNSTDGEANPPLQPARSNSTALSEKRIRCSPHEPDVADEYCWFANLLMIRDDPIRDGRASAVSLNFYDAMLSRRDAPLCRPVHRAALRRAEVVFAARHARRPRPAGREGENPWARAEGGQSVRGKRPCSERPGSEPRDTRQRSSNDGRTLACRHMEAVPVFCFSCLSTCSVFFLCDVRYTLFCRSALYTWVAVRFLWWS